MHVTHDPTVLPRNTRWTSVFFPACALPFSTQPLYSSSDLLQCTRSFACLTSALASASALSSGPQRLRLSESDPELPEASHLHALALSLNSNHDSLCPSISQYTDYVHSWRPVACYVNWIAMQHACVHKCISASKSENIEESRCQCSLITQYAAYTRIIPSCERERSMQ